MSRFVVAGLLLASGALAQTKKEPRVVQMPTVIIEAERQHPNAFYVLQRTPIRYDADSGQQDFLPKILTATGKHPF